MSSLDPAVSTARPPPASAAAPRGGVIESSRRAWLKYLAGTELAAGFFAMDALPEEKARELQQVQAGIA